MSGKVYEGKTLLETMTVDFITSSLSASSTVTSSLTVIT